VSTWSTWPADQPTRNCLCCTMTDVTFQHSTQHFTELNDSKTLQVTVHSGTTCEESDERNSGKSQPILILFAEAHRDQFTTCILCKCVSSTERDLLSGKAT